MILNVYVDEETQARIEEAAKELGRSPESLAESLVSEGMLDWARNRPKPKPVSSRREDWHYDSQGYCDNPGRGY